jgi:hypothetical protein
VRRACERRPYASGSVGRVADDPLIIQFADGAAVERQLRGDPPPSVASGAAVLDAGPADDRGRLEPPAAGQVVLSVPSPEALGRQADDVRRVIDEAGDGVEPLVVVLEAADELREDELAPVVDAARRSRRSVILRVAADG